MDMAWQLDYLVETDMVELANFLPMDSVDRRDKLTIAVSPAIFLAHPLSIAVLSLVHGLDLSLTLVFAKDYSDSLLAGGMACREVEQLPHRPRLATSELMDECFISHAIDECSDHVRIHDIGKLIALLGKAVDVLAQSLSRFLLAGLEILGISWAHICALKVPYEDALEVCP